MKPMKYLLAFWLFLGTTPAIAQNKTAFTDTTSFKVFGACNMCKDRIEASLKIKGVSYATWNLEDNLLSLAYDTSKISLDKIHEKLVAVGHDTYLKKTTDALYEALPACCKYRQQISQAPATSSHIENITLKPNQATGEIIKGVVLKEDSKGNFTPLIGASVIWFPSNLGTTTDEHGVFSTKKNGEKLIVSYSGFEPDTINITTGNDLKIVLATGNMLKEVKVSSSRAATYIASVDPFRTQVITQKELFKAACCNLSESFETNPSVDVSYNDAVTGSKQIQLLGLAGVYTQLTVENLPGPRGLSTALGLNSIPGTFIESIQLSKGTGSVANGFESIAGQINVELKKPATSEKLYANVYVNDFGRVDVNLNITKVIGPKWATTLLLHNDYFNNKKLDLNNDGFRDLPTGNLFSIINRWAFTNNKGLLTQFGIKVLSDEKTGGQPGYKSSDHRLTNKVYGIEINTSRVEAFGKIGYVFPQKKFQSIGLQLSAFNYKQESSFGLTTDDAKQKSFYSNLIYQSIINSTIHKFRTGLSFVYDEYNEMFNLKNYQRNEIVPGGFFEYTFTPSGKFDLVAGLRQDHNNLFGWFTTPRINLRYEPVKGTIVRASFGRGQRTANIFAENNGVFASSRKLDIITAATGGAYGLKPEVAWNKGISIDQKFKLFNRSATASVDFFRNDFTNQVIVDVERAQQIRFYNLKGKSYSNSLQAEVSFIPIPQLDVKLAYRMFDVRSTYDGELLQKPFIAQNRAFSNIAYEIKGWKLDYTISFNSRKRLPSIATNPSNNLTTYSPAFVTMNAQISKTLGKLNLIDVYLGGENLSNYFQTNTIVSATQPFAESFDASMIWGPITGRMIYMGMRYRIK